MKEAPQKHRTLAWNPPIVWSYNESIFSVEEGPYASHRSSEVLPIWKGSDSLFESAFLRSEFYHFDA